MRPRQTPPRTMTSRQLKNAISHLSVSQAGVGYLTGYSDRAVRRWIAGRAKMPLSAAIIVRLLVQGIAGIDDVERAQRN